MVRIRGVDLAPAIAVLAAIAAGLVVIVVGNWRIGVGIFGGAVVSAGLLRLCLAPSRVGTLRTRTRAVDTLCLVPAGVLIIVLAFVIPTPLT